MDAKGALKSQYKAALMMMRQCIERCPDDLWTSGAYPRTFDRISAHGVFYTDLYMRQDVESHTDWKDVTFEKYVALDEEAAEDEHIPRQHLLEYLDYVFSEVDKTVDGLDVDTNESGFYWYKNISKMEHQMMNLRHLHGHIGQLSEILMANGIEIDWVARV